MNHLTNIKYKSLVFFVFVGFFLRQGFSQKTTKLSIFTWTHERKVNKKKVRGPKDGRPSKAPVQK